MKKCPFCAEKIQDEAIKCRYCGEFLTEVSSQNKIVKGSIDMELRETNHEDADFYYNVGVASYNLGDYEKAIKFNDIAIKLNPRFANAYANRGFANRALGNYQQAIKDLDKAIALNPQDSLAYNNRGAIYGILGDHQKSMDDLKKAARLGNAKTQDFLRMQGIDW